MLRVSSSTVFQWADHFARSPRSDNFAEQARALAENLIQQLDQPTAMADIPFRLRPTASDELALAWLKQTKIILG